MTSSTSRQYLHLVFGGRLESLDSGHFADIEALDIVGFYTNYDAAYKAWRGVSQRTVDDALMRYFIVHIHNLIDPLFDRSAAAASIVAEKIGHA